MAMLADRLTLPSQPQGLLMQDPKHVRDKYARLTLSDAQKSRVCFTKLTDPSANSTYRPDVNHPWVLQYTAHEKVNMADADGTPVHVNREDERGGIADTAGVIMTFHGTAARTVALDITSPVPRMISVEEAETSEEAFNVSFPRRVLWEFRLHEAIYTDGPDRNARLHEAAEELRAQQEERTMQSQQKFYESMTTNMASMVAQIVTSITKGGGKADPQAIAEEVQKARGKAEGGEIDKSRIENEDLKAATEEWEGLSRETGEIISGGTSDLNVSVTSAEKYGEDTDSKGRKKK